MRQKDRLFAAAAALVIAAGAAWGVWRDAQHKFQNASMPAADTELQLEQFLTAYAVPEQAEFVTDVEEIDCNAVGQYPITLRHGQREETVTLTILDTYAPQLTLQDLEVNADHILAPEEFVAEVWDHSDVTLSFGEPVEIPEDYSDLAVQIVATDAYGNQTTAQCNVSFLWMRDTVYLEYGESLSYADVLYNPEKDADMLRAGALYSINTASTGTYTLNTTSHGRVLSCNVVVQDTTSPELELKEHKVYPNGYVTVSDFVKSSEDASGDVTLSFVTKPDTSVQGKQTVVIRAEDIHGNVTTGETTLRVVSDIYSPVIYGASQELTVAKFSEPDFMDGVYAYDNKDRYVEITVDAGMVDTSAAGTYYITYTAWDDSENETTLRRKVTVLHDEEDTKALVAALAATLPDDPELLRDYVRDNISYSSDWGGEDPVWNGFTDSHGNCYVHALCLKALLDEKGYNNQLIWVTNYTHYWLIIEIEPGVWRHIDATPGTQHTKYSLMDDQQRLATLSGRRWHFTEWPACE